MVGGASGLNRLWLALSILFAVTVLFTRVFCVVLTKHVVEFLRESPVRFVEVTRSAGDILFMSR